MVPKFPSQGAPVVVTKEMCDLNNHMNVVYYQHIFEDGCHDFYRTMGFTKEHFKEGYSSFTLETNIRYLKEIREGETATPYFRILKNNLKLIHYAGIITNQAGDVSSFSEHVLAHIDMRVRKTCPMPNQLLGKLKKMLEHHRTTGPIDFELRLNVR